MIDYREHPAYQAMRSGRSDLAIGMLENQLRTTPRDAMCWKLLGLALHNEQLEPEAVEALRNARALATDDAEIAIALAQSCFFAGYPAVRAFVDVMRVDPQNLDALRGYALALSAIGDPAEGIRVLKAALSDFPDWIPGHKLLATLRYTMGDTVHFNDSYARACALRPDNLELHIAWFESVAQVRDWDQVNAIIDIGVKRFGSRDEWVLAQLFVASENGDDSAAERLFAETESVDDVRRDMALVRFSLRRRDFQKAEDVCTERLRTSSANAFWPYLAVVWQLNNDERLAWLTRNNSLIATETLDLGPRKLNALAQRLRSLHTASNPYAEQSIRKGTQTDQNLLLRHEPEIRELRDKLRNAVRSYVEKLPHGEPEHPFLRHDRREAARGRVHFSGSWSVRLGPHGYNVPHTHPMGWISSAMYVSLPADEDMGDPPAGWIQFGTPPEELGLSLEPTKRVKPVAGQVVFFPSLMWHSTLPFEKGERLVVAIDVKPPSVH